MILKILEFPNIEQLFIFHTDAFGFVLGTVLSYVNDRRLAYASKTLTQTEQNNSTTEK